jgi:catalase
VPSMSQTDLAAQIVDAARVLAGAHPGYRPLHAKGTVCSGTFVAAAEASRISKAAHLQGQNVPVICRFSNASGDPNVHDGLPSVRALAVKFLLADGHKTDIVANSIEGFRVGTGEDFLAFLQANRPEAATGKPNPDRVASFVERQPTIEPFMRRFREKCVPASLARTTYHANHAFRFTAADGSSRFGRYRWIPEAGEAFLDPQEASQRDSNFLLAELKGRLAKGPVAFRLNLQIAEPSDPTHDVTVLWPADRRLIELGRLEIDSISATSAADERRLIFDPTNLTEGIEPGDDPLPALRSAAYSISYAERTKGV